MNKTFQTITSATTNNIYQVIKTGWHLECFFFLAQIITTTQFVEVD